MKNGALALTALGAVAAVLAACTLTTTTGPITDVDGGRVDSGTTSDGGTSDAATTNDAATDGSVVCGSNVDFQDPACNACSQNSCCTEVTGCFGAPASNDSDCAKLNQAVADCKGDSTCEKDARDAFPTGVAAYDTMITCLTTKCASTCAN